MKKKIIVLYWPSLKLIKQNQTNNKYKPFLRNTAATTTVTSSTATASTTATT